MANAMAKVRDESTANPHESLREAEWNFLEKWEKPVDFKGGG